jgi:hypothetical protein
MTATEPTARSAPDWAEIRRLYEERPDLHVSVICERMGVKLATLRWRAKRHGWQLRRPAVQAKAPALPRTVLDRLYNAIELKVKQLEENMSQDGPKSPADAERETRTIGSLIRNVEKVTELKGELDRAGAEPQLRSHHLTPEESERLYLELAKRIRQFARGEKD